MSTGTLARGLRLAVGITLPILGGALAGYCGWVSLMAYSLAGVLGLQHIEYLDIQSVMTVALIFGLGLALVVIGKRAIGHRAAYSAILWMFAVFPFAFSYYYFWIVFASGEEQTAIYFLVASSLALLCIGLVFWGWRLWRQEAIATESKGQA